jgi:hypothetical protein
VKNEDLKKAIAATIPQGHRGPTPEGVVEAARAETSPLHGFFEWDDNIAGEKYRLGQARDLIVRVGPITLKIDDDREVLVPHMYVRDPSAMPREQGYIDISRIEPRGEEARQILNQEMARIMAGIHRARPIAIALGFEVEFEELFVSANRFADVVRGIESEDVAA